MTTKGHEYQPVQNSSLSYLVQEYRTDEKRRQDETPCYKRWEEVWVRCPEFTPKYVGPSFLRLRELTTIK